MSSDFKTTATTSRSIFFNVFANFTSQAWAALLSLVCIPLYIRLIGMEAFGLLGFYASIQTILRVLDLGMTPTVTRDIARSKASPDGQSQLPNIARTFEVFFAAIGFAIAIGITLFSSTIAINWLNPQSLSTGTVSACVFIMGLQCGLNWLSSFYQSGLQGLEQQVTLNGLRIAEASFSTIGSILLLLFVAPSVVILFSWQCFISTLATIGYGIAFNSALPASETKPRFKLQHLLHSSGFATGMTAITALQISLLQADKIILSKTLSLEHFGQYSLAYYLASSLFAIIVNPFFNVLFPRFSFLIATGDTEKLQNVYHLAEQIFAALMFPFLATLFLFGNEFLELWGIETQTAKEAAPLLTLLTLGVTFNALYVPAFTIEISQGWVGLATKIYLVVFIIYAPSLAYSTLMFGAFGAAMTFAAMNATTLLLTLPIVHKRFLPKDLSAVVFRDIFPALAICAAATMATISIQITEWPRANRLLFGLVFGTTSLAASALASPRLRGELAGKYKKLIHLLFPNKQ